MYKASTWDRRTPFVDIFDHLLSLPPEDLAHGNMRVEVRDIYQYRTPADSDEKTFDALKFCVEVGSVTSLRRVLSARDESNQLIMRKRVNRIDRNLDEIFRFYPLTLAFLVSAQVRQHSVESNRELSYPLIDVLRAFLSMRDDVSKRSIVRLMPGNNEPPALDEDGFGALAMARKLLLDLEAFRQPELYKQVEALLKKSAASSNHAIEERDLFALPLPEAKTFLRRYIDEQPEFYKVPVGGETRFL